MYGGFQGIIGGTLPEIEGMSLPQLEAHIPENDASGSDGETPVLVQHRRRSRRSRRVATGQ